MQAAIRSCVVQIPLADVGLAGDVQRKFFGAVCGGGLIYAYM